MTEEKWQEVNSSCDAWDELKPLQGVYVEKKTGIGPNESNMYVIEQENGELLGIWGSTVKDSKFSSVELGAEIRIESLGETTSKAGKKYKDYSLKKRPAPFREVKETTVTADDVDMNDVDKILNS